MENMEKEHGEAREDLKIFEFRAALDDRFLLFVEIIFLIQEGAHFSQFHVLTALAQDKSGEGKQRVDQKVIGKIGRANQGVLVHVFDDGQEVLFVLGLNN